MDAERNDEAAREYFSAFERWDLETAAGFLADDVVEGVRSPGSALSAPRT
jgi:hypothetical protein